MISPYNKNFKIDFTLKSEDSFSTFSEDTRCSIIGSLPGIVTKIFPTLSSFLIGAGIGSFHSILIFVLLNSIGETIFLTLFSAIKLILDCFPSHTFAIV